MHSRSCASSFALALVLFLIPAYGLSLPLPGSSIISDSGLRSLPQAAAASSRSKSPTFAKSTSYEAEYQEGERSKMDWGAIRKQTVLFKDLALPYFK